jgi:hypothetical protein
VINCKGFKNWIRQESIMPPSQMVAAAGTSEFEIPSLEQNSAPGYDDFGHILEHASVAFRRWEPAIEPGHLIRKVITAGPQRHRRREEHQ